MFAECVNSYTILSYQLFKDDNMTVVFTLVALPPRDQKKSMNAGLNRGAFVMD